MELKDLVSDEMILEAFKNTNLVYYTDKRDLISTCLLGVACDLTVSHTLKCIFQKLGLIGNPKYKTPTLTKKGKQYLFMCYENK